MHRVDLRALVTGAFVIFALVLWMRANLTDQPPWPDVARLVAESRKMEPSMLRFPPGGSGSDPLRTGSP